MNNFLFIRSCVSSVILMRSARHSRFLHSDVRLSIMGLLGNISAIYRITLSSQGKGIVTQYTEINLTI
jgi:hypothetical protein